MLPDTGGLRPDLPEDGVEAQSADEGPLERPARLPEIAQLTAFVAVAEELHFTRAATLLSTSQPWLSHQISALEKQIGARLFRRTKRRVELTQAGVLFLGAARASLAAVGEAVQLAQAAERGEAGRLRIGFVGGPAFEAIPHHLRSFRVDNPGIELVLREESSPRQLHELLDHELDVGYVRTAKCDGLAALAVDEEEILIVLASDHPLATLEAVPLSALAGMSYICPSREFSPDLSDRVAGLFQAAGVAHRPVVEVTTANTRVALVAAGMGFSVVLSKTFVAQGDQIDTVLRPIEGARATMTLSLTWREDDSSRLVRRYVEHVRRITGRVTCHMA
jgi:DNA-binding transcriptional LysR family regulator